MNIKWSIFILTLAVFGCYEPADLDLSLQEEKMVFFAALTPDKVGLKASLTTNRALGSNLPAIEDQFITNADIGIFENGALIRKLHYSSPSAGEGNDPFYGNDDFKAETNKTYELSINVEGFEPVKATCLIPSPVTVYDVQIENWSDIPIDTLPNSFRWVTATGSLLIDDDPNVNNYYHLAEAEMYFDWVNFAGDTIYNQDIELNIPVENISPEEPAFVPVPNLPGFLIDDNKLEPGMRVPFRVSFLRKTTNDFGRFKINLRHCDEAYFNFYHSWARQLENDQAFDPQVPVRTNIEDGLGYFSGYSVGQGQFDSW